MKTTIIVDNATLAAAGRATYRTNLTGLPNESKTHIEAYGVNYPTSVASDVVSLSELISALILFDELIWNRGSFVEESKDQFTSNHINQECWVYRWFPIFKVAYEFEALNPFRDYDDIHQQENAQNAAMDWVKRNFSSFKKSLPADFKIPEAYKSNKYHYLEEFNKKNSLYNLNEYELAVAMFIHRGLFYLSQAYNIPGASYLPHGNRASFLVDDELSIQAYIVSGKLFNRKIYGVSASDIKGKIEDILKAKRTEAIGTVPLELNSVGGAFLHKHGARDAFSRALEFRETKKGTEVRDLFRRLVDAGNNADNITVNLYIEELTKEVNDVILSGLGGKLSDSITRIKFMGIPDWVSFIIQYLPVKVQNSIVKNSNKVLNPSGFQMIFSNYIK